MAPQSRFWLLSDSFLSSRRTLACCTLWLALLLGAARRDYCTFLSYGPGGLPHNWKGWLMSTMLRAISRETLSTRIYSHQPFSDVPSYLESPLPPRAGSPPNIGPHPVPQRQLDQLPNRHVREQLIARFKALGQQLHSQGLVEVRRSVYEKQHDAMFVAKSKKWHALAQETFGEISHLHAGLDGSLHVVLSPQDCKLVLDVKWGRRHALDGVDLLKKFAGVTLPVNYMMIYAPRDEAEIQVALRLVKAGVDFMADERLAHGV